VLHDAPGERGVIRLGDEMDDATVGWTDNHAGPVRVRGSIRTARLRTPRHDAVMAAPTCNSTNCMGPLAMPIVQAKATSAMTATRIDASAGARGRSFAGDLTSS
jgi:hypothetical protein